MPNNIFLFVTERETEKGDVGKFEPVQRGNEAAGGVESPQGRVAEVYQARICVQRWGSA